MGIVLSFQVNGRLLMKNEQHCHIILDVNTFVPKDISERIVPRLASVKEIIIFVNLLWDASVNIASKVII